MLLLSGSLPDTLSHSADFQPRWRICLIPDFILPTNRTPLGTLSEEETF